MLIQILSSWWWMTCWWTRLTWLFADLAKVAREVDRRKAYGAWGHPVRGGAEEQAQVAMQQHRKNHVLIISKMILPRNLSYLKNNPASKIIPPKKKNLPALSLPLPIECWVYNATRSLSFVKETLVNSKFKFLMKCQQARWSVESVHTKNIVSILHLLVALARHFRWNSWSS